MKRILHAGSALVLVLASATSATANPKIYEQALASTGWLINPSAKNTALGTCWIANRAERLVITSAHLVGKSKEVLVFFPQRVDGKLMVEASHYLKKCATVNGRVVITDPQRDLALVQLDCLPDGAMELTLANVSARPGDDVHSIGNSGLAKNAGGMLWRYTRGSVRQVYARKIKTDDAKIEVQIVETQSPVNMGDSGGALLNQNGEVVGVIAAYDPDERLVSQNIDVSEIRAFLKTSLADLAKKSDPKKGAAPTAKRRSPVGEWQMSAKLDDGTKANGTAHFRGDGTYLLQDSVDADEGSQHGRFLYANGMLLLIADDGQATFRLVWENDNEFSASHKGVELSFHR